MFEVIYEIPPNGLTLCVSRSVDVESVSYGGQKYVPTYEWTVEKHRFIKLERADD